MKYAFKLNATDDLTQLLKEDGIAYWQDLTTKVKALPYGRNANRSDFTLVWKEQKGTCSSKHAFLKHVAGLNHLPYIELILGMFKMNNSNTPKIGNVLYEHQLDYIPEAHCYLKIHEKRIDYTAANSDFNKIENDILLEKTIKPEEVAEYKVRFHKAYLRGWIKNNNISHSFEDIWNIREQCIANLSM